MARAAGLVLALILLTTSAGQAQMMGAPQGMPNLRAMSGKPLSVGDLAPGTVSVRVARKLPANAVADAQVIAFTTTSSGEGRTHTARTGTDGRVTFEGLPPGVEFHAEVTVDGEKLASSTFPIPPQGGTRIMLIAGLAGGDSEGETNQEAEAAPGDGDPATFLPGATAGTAEPAAELPAGSLEVEVTSTQGQPVPNKRVHLGHASTTDNKLAVDQTMTDAHGVARFSGLATGETVGYLVVVELQGMRLSVGPFRMAPNQGMRARIKGLERTADSSVLRLEPRSRIAVEAREDVLVVMEILVFKNASDKVFDPGPEGLFIPLPSGFVSFSADSEGTDVKEKAGTGALLHATIPPNSGARFVTQARFLFGLRTQGSDTVTFSQPMPFGMESPILITQGTIPIALDAPGLTHLADQGDPHGGGVMRGHAVPEILPGGALTVTVSGLPKRDKTGHFIAGTLTALLALAAVFGGARKRGAHTAGDAAQRLLIERRERLFAELVELERRRREHGPPALDAQRRDLVVQLESVYRELAAASTGQSVTMEGDMAEREPGRP